MKALKSPLAKRLLADPRNRAQLQKVNDNLDTDASGVVIELKVGTETRRYLARVVPQAA